MNVKKVLITAGRSPIALEFTRQLSGLGHQVIIVDTSNRYITKYSNYIYKSYTLPSPRFHCDQFIHGLKTLLKKEHVDLYIPVFEEAFYVAKNINVFEGKVKIFCDNFDKLITLHNKWLFNRILKKYNLFYPKSKILHNTQEIKNVPNDKYLLKKIYNHAAQDIIYINSSLDRKKMIYCEKNPWLMQELIHGKKFCTYSVCHSGILNACSIYPVQYSIDNSSCVYYESIEHDGILKWIKEFVHKINYTGQIGFDFIETNENKLYAIECNPRPTAGIHLFDVKDGIDQAIFNQNSKLITPKSGIKKMIGLGMLLYGWRTSKKMVPNKSFLKTVLISSDIVYKKNDIKPFIAQFILCTFYLLKAKKEKMKLTAFFYYDLVWTCYEKKDQKNFLKSSNLTVLIE